MKRVAFFASIVLIGCSSAGPKDDPIVGLRERGDAGVETTKAGEVAQSTNATQPSVPDTSSSASTTPATETPPSPDAGADADASAPMPVCDLGNGLYCGGNHAPGAANELYRCTNGVPTLVETCTANCARYPEGLNDHCECWLGDGLYCGGNGVNGDANTLYRCTGGVPTVETVCASTCSIQPNGINDKCL